MKVLLVLFLVALATSRYVREDHEYWYTVNRKAAETNVPFADVAWNYCDLKCTYLEKLYPNTDFYVVNFKDAFYKPNFSACYAKQTGGTDKLWNKVASNDFFEANCGGDSEDYLHNDAYEKISEEGRGIGTKIEY